MGDGINAKITQPAIALRFAGILYLLVFTPELILCPE